jgi:transglutaminase-like putative cysteine protease
VNILKSKPKAGKSTKIKKKEPRAEQSLGIRLVAVTMNLLLILASASYVPTLPITTFLFAMLAILGSYLAWAYRDNRPGWVSTIPTVATMILFTNFFFELFTGYTAGAHTAVGAFIHMLTGLLALHCFDLRTRTDFSISALIGLGLLTCLAGMARDMIYGFYIFTYTILAGLLLFYDSSSRSHEIGPSRALPGVQAPPKIAQNATLAGVNVGAAADQLVKRLKVSSITALLPVFVLPFLSVLAFTGLPRIDSVIDLFKDNFVRAQFPLSATLSGQLGKGGHSQSIRGGAPDSKPQGGASYTVKGGETGTASGTRPKDDEDNDGSGKGAGAGVPNKVGTGKGAKAPANLGGKKDPAQQAGIEKQLEKERSLNEQYQKETVEMKGAANKAEEILLKVSSPQPTYIRRYSLNDFDGMNWSRSLPVNPKTIEKGSDNSFDLTASDCVYVPPNLPTLEIKQDFRVEEDNVFGHILPHTWIPQLVKLKGISKNGAKGEHELRIDGDGAIKLLESLSTGSTYSITSQIPVYDFEQMRHLPFETLEQVTEERDEEVRIARSCQKPYTADGDRVQQFGVEIAGQDGNWFYRADRISEFLRKNYKYDAASFYKDDGSDKESTSTFVEDFLFVKKRGNCRHFATAFAVLCRSQGIPARIVTGYSPGELNKTTGFYEIKGKNAHVWAEIYMPYWNWVPFDATPGGQLPAHEEGGNTLTRFIKSGLANPFGQDYTASRKRKKHNDQFSFGQGKENDKEKKNDFFNFGLDKNKKEKVQLPIVGQVDQGTMQQIFKYSVVLIASLILLVVLALYLRQRKEAQMKDFMQTHKPSTLVFLEVLSELKRYELLKGPTETADELSLRLNDRVGEVSQSGHVVPDQLPAILSEFMAIYSEDRFGGDDKLDELKAMSARIKSLAQAKRRK